MIQLLITTTLLHFIITANASKIIPPVQEIYTYKEGDEISLNWSYELSRGQDFFNMKCGRKNVSSSKVITDDSDVIALAEMINDGSGTPILRLLPAMPPNYIGRVKISQGLKNGMTLVIQQARKTDSGEYLCVLKVFDNDITRIQTIRSVLRTLTTNEEAGAQSSSGGSGNRTTILIIILVVLAVIVIAVVIGVLIYRRKVKKETNEEIALKGNDSKPLQDNMERKNNPIKNRNMQYDDSKGYAKVQVVSTPEEALHGKTIVYIDEDDEPNGFV